MMEVPPKWDLVFCEESLPLARENQFFSSSSSTTWRKKLPGTHWRQWLTPTWELHLQQSLQHFFFWWDFFVKDFISQLQYLYLLSLSMFLKIYIFSFPYDRMRYIHVVNPFRINPKARKRNFPSSTFSSNESYMLNNVCV